MSKWLHGYTPCNNSRSQCFQILKGCREYRPRRSEVSLGADQLLTMSPSLCTLSNCCIFIEIFLENVHIVNTSDKKVLNSKRSTGNALKIRSYRNKRRFNKVLNYTIHNVSGVFPPTKE